MTPLTLQLDHPANQLGGLRDIVLADTTLTFHAERPTTALIVVRSAWPLRANAGVELQPGWDGSLGYGLYGLTLRVERPGPWRVVLEVVPPPVAPIPTAEREIEEFQAAYAARASRFPDDAARFRDWQRAYRAKLVGWLMGGAWPQRVPLEARVIAMEERRAFTLHTIEYRSQPDRTTTALLARPHNVPNAPLLLALHGHEAGWGQADVGAFTAGHNDDFCAYFAARGWAVLQPATMNHTRQHPGWTLQGEWTWDALVALDYAATGPGINADRVAVCGLSTGGHLAMNVLALDDRIRAGVVGCALSTWHHYARRVRLPPSCDCGIVAQLGPRLEQCDWAALAAPKPVQFQQGRQDAFFCPGAPPEKVDLVWHTGVMPQAEYDTMFAEIQRAYRLAGGATPVDLHYHDAGHRVDNPAALAFLNQHFRGR